MISCGNFELRVYGHWVIAKPNETFFKKFWRTSVLFVRSLISLFWTPGLVCWRNETFLHCKEMGRLLMWNLAVCDFAFAVAQREQTQKGSVTCAIQKILFIDTSWILNDNLPNYLHLSSFSTSFRHFCAASLFDAANRSLMSLVEILGFWYFSASCTNSRNWPCTTIKMWP